MTEKNEAIEKTQYVTYKAFSYVSGEANLELRAQREGFDFPTKMWQFIGKNQLILDIGCGVGTQGKQIKDYGNNKVYGIDVNEDCVNYSKRRIDEARVCNINIEPIPYADNMFDLVICFEVLQHIIDWNNLFSEARRVLKPNCKFLIFGLNFFSFFPKDRLISMIFNKHYYQGDHNLRLTSPYNVADRLEKFFEPSKIKVNPKEYRVNGSRTLLGKLAGRLLPQFIFDRACPHYCIIAEK